MALKLTKEQKEKLEEIIENISLPALSYKIEEMGGLDLDGGYKSEYVDIEDVLGYKQRILNAIESLDITDKQYAVQSLEENSAQTKQDKDNWDSEEGQTRFCAMHNCTDENCYENHPCTCRKEKYDGSKSGYGFGGIPKESKNEDCPRCNQSPYIEHTHKPIEFDGIKPQESNKIEEIAETPAWGTHELSVLCVTKINEIINWINKQ